MYLKEDIRQNLTNHEMFNIFIKNHKILYFLIENKMIELDDTIINILISPSHNVYFMPIIDRYFTGTFSDDYDIEKIKCGENESYIARLIRNDLVQEFIIYINKMNIKPYHKIIKSDFETNQFLRNKEPTLIEYAVFFGSISIFKYLQMNGVELTPSLWLYAIHSNNPELIHILEENVKLDDKTYEDCILYSIKCHHNDFAKYFLEKKNQNKCYFLHCLELDNYEIMPTDLDSFSKLNLSFDQILTYINYDNDLFYLLFKESYLDINYEKDNKRFLSFAIEKNDIRLIKFLLSNPKIDPNYIQRIGSIYNAMTELSKAVENNNIELIKLFLECPNTDPNVQIRIEINDKNGIKYIARTALSMAIVMENIEIVKILLSNEKTNPNADNELLLAIEKDNDEIVKLLINDQRTNFNEPSEEYGERQSILFRLVEEKNIKMIKLFLDCPYFDPNVIHTFIRYPEKGYFMDDKTPLSIAIENEDLEIIKLLLECPKIEPNNKKLRFIHYIFDGEYNSREVTELSLAIEKGNDEIIQLLFNNQRINPNIIFTDENYQNGTVLSKAVEEGNIELIKLLLKCPNIDIDTKIDKKIVYNEETSCESSILQLALYTQNKDVICLLFEHKRRNLIKS